MRLKVFFQKLKKNFLNFVNNNTFTRNNFPTNPGI